MSALRASLLALTLFSAGFGQEGTVAAVSRIVRVPPTESVLQILVGINSTRI